MFVVVHKDNGRLCKDGLFRSFAHFGTFPECVRTYRHRGHAERRQRLLELRGEKGTLSVVEIPTGQAMDACGRIEAWT